jgi:hypothetical protein
MRSLLLLASRCLIVRHSTVQGACWFPMSRFCGATETLASCAKCTAGRSRSGKTPPSTRAVLYPATVRPKAAPKWAASYSPQKPQSRPTISRTAMFLRMTWFWLPLWLIGYRRGRAVEFLERMPHFRSESFVILNLFQDNEHRSRVMLKRVQHDEVGLGCFGVTQTPDQKSYRRASDDSQDRISLRFLLAITPRSHPHRP